MESNELSRREAFRLGMLGVSAAALAGCADIKLPTGPPSSPPAPAKLGLRDFLALSEELTGIKPLDAHLGAEHMKRYADNPSVGPYLQGLLAAYNSIKLFPPAEQSAAWETRVFGPNAFFRPAAEQLVYLWYMSTFALRDQVNPNKVVWQYENEHHYNKALLWKVIHGHPPMTTPSKWVERPQSGS